MFEGLPFWNHRSFDPSNLLAMLGVIGAYLPLLIDYYKPILRFLRAHGAELGICSFAIGSPTMAVYTHESLYVMPMGIMLWLFWPASSCASAPLLSKILLKLHKLIMRHHGKYTFRNRHIVGYPSTKRMVFLNTFHSIAITYLIATSGGFFSGSVFDLNTHLATIVPLYMLSLALSSAINGTLWILAKEGFVHIPVGGRPVNLGEQISRLVSVALPAAMVMSLGLFAYSYHAQLQNVIFMLVFLGSLGLASTSVSFWLGKKKMFARLGIDVRRELLACISH